MSKLTLILCYCVFLVCLHEISGLKCRTGNQQTDEQFQKIMQVCRRRYLGYGRNNGEFSRESDSEESDDSDEDMFDNKFLSSGRNRYGYGNDNGYGYGNEYGGGGRYGGNSDRSSSRNGSRQSRNQNWSSRGPYSSSFTDRSRDKSNYSNGRDSMNSRGNYNSNNSNYNNDNNGDNDQRGNDDDEREEACVVQCFFNELNLVDQRGFPERSAVTGIMTQNIQDPELRDFVEESITQCYHYLNANPRQEKCKFSQNLLSCLADKGSERCEDWDDQ